jgi:hypothetical protein
MVSADSLVAPRDRFDDLPDEHPGNDYAYQSPQPRIVTTQPDAASSAKVTVPRPISQTGNADDLDGARGILFGVILGTIGWGLIGGLVYLLMA